LHSNSRHAKIEKKRFAENKNRIDCVNKNRTGLAEYKNTGRMRNEQVRSLETIITAAALSNSPQ